LNYARKGHFFTFWLRFGSGLRRDTTRGPIRV